jgi:hypothetical protein
MIIDHHRSIGTYRPSSIVALPLDNIYHNHKEEEEYSTSLQPYLFPHIRHEKKGYFRYAISNLKYLSLYNVYWLDCWNVCMYHPLLHNGFNHKQQPTISPTKVLTLGIQPLYHLDLRSREQHWRFHEEKSHLFLRSIVNTHRAPVNMTSIDHTDPTRNKPSNACCCLANTILAGNQMTD